MIFIIVEFFILFFLTMYYSYFLLAIFAKGLMSIGKGDLY